MLKLFMMADEVDLYGDDDDFNQEGDYNHDSNVDLYEDVLTAPSEGSVHNEEGRPSSASSYTERRHLTHSQGKRFAVYVGNLTWWTTDKDICDGVRSIGINDVLEVKFYENRANGQSKGFCLVAVSSETSYRSILDKLPKKVLHGKNPEVLPCSKQNLSHFETVSRKGGNHGNHTAQGGHRYDNSGDKYNRESREREKDNRSDSTRSGPPDRSRVRSNAPPTSAASGNQRQQSAPNMGHPPPQPIHPQYPPGRAPWMAGPPPQIYQMPPNPRPGMPPNAAPPPPPPGIQAPPPPRPIPPPHANVRVPPPRGPLPPIGPRNVPPPDPRAPPPQHDWERIAVSQPPPQVGMPSQPSGPPNRPPPPVPAPGQNMPPSIHPPAPHVNPAFFLPHNQGISPTMPPVSQPVDVYSRPPPVQYPEYRPSNDRNSDPATAAVSETEFEDIMNRNRTVSSSAISRAVADASAGDFTSAIETLVTAISLIKQSKIANDERCKILISSLQDTLHGVEAKSYSSSSRSKERPRSRERSRERSRRDKSSRRERSRSRDYRDRSRERDRYHDDRYHEKDHDRDRDRDRRSHRH